MSMNTSDCQLVKDRATGIGGTDAAAILYPGANPWKSAVDVYLEKMQISAKHNSLKSKSSELKFDVGNKLEQLVVDLFQSKLKLTVKTGIPLQRHPKFPYLLAHVDGFIESRNLVFEAKTCGLNAILSRTWSKERLNYKAEVSDIPYQYYCQLQWYCMITNSDGGYLACLMGGNEDFRVYFYERDYELGIQMRKAAKHFWQEHVLKKKPPEPVSLKDSSNIHQKHTDKFKKSTAGISALVNKAKSIRAQLKQLYAKKEALDARITDFIGQNEGLINDEGHTEATWKENRAGKRLLRLF